MRGTKKRPAPKASASARPTKKPTVKYAGVEGAFGFKPVTAKKVKSTKSGKAKTTVVRSPLTDEELGSIPGLPTEAEIEQWVGNLDTAHKTAFTKIRRLLAEHLGSHAAARAWLTTPGGGFEGTPLDAIRDGMAEHVLKLLNAQWSRNPSYA
jgi:hypothetical protein